MKSKESSKKLFWVLVVLLLFVLAIRLLDSVIGSTLGRAGEIVLLVLAIIVLLWIIGNRN